MPATSILGVSTVISGAMAIATHGPARHRWHYVFKPLTTALILLLALIAPADTGPGSRALFALGLAFSLAGDVFLMLPRERFVAGLASFGAAHLCYIAAFGGTLRTCPSLLSYLPYLALAGGLLALLWRGVGALRLPLAVYALVIVSMAWLAGARWTQQGTPAALQSWAGALLFVLSDSLLALDRFRRPIPYRHVLVLGSYYAGQLLIALGV